MAATKYNYPVTDFPNNKVNPDRLEVEIRASDITAAFAFLTIV